MEYWGAFKKDTANCIHGCFPGFLSDVVQQAYDGAIQVAPKLIRAVCWK
jgi:hypothetical protein